MQKSDAAAYLAGVKQVEGAQASAPTNLHVITGEVGQKSENGTTTVIVDGLVFSENDSQEIEMDTIGGLEEGDIATVILTGESGHGMTPLAIGAIGSVDRVEVIAVDAQESATLAAEAAAAAQDSADDAATAAANAQTSAEAAASAASTANANAIQAINDAASAASAASDAQESAEDAAEAASIANANALDAIDSAASARASAANANSHAVAALNSLSTVENVVDTLTWITEHGTMTLTADVAIDPTKVYFVLDNNGNYTVGNYRYSIVQEPDVSDLSEYYELSIDKSVENYIASHLSLTNEGLWLTPNTTTAFRILLATGLGSTYTTPGTYIIDNTDTNNPGAIIGQFASTGIRFAENKSFYIGDNSAYIFFDGQGHITIGGTGVTIGSNLTLQQLIDKYNDAIVDQMVWYGTCSTSAGTTAKSVTCADFELLTGVRITIRFSNANTAASPTLNVNSKGAKAVWYNNETASATNPVRWGANATLSFVYDGTYWVLDEKPPSYAAPCSTTASTRAKTATVVGALVVNGTTVSLQCSTANTYASNSVTFNLSSTGALTVYRDNAATSTTNKLLWDANTVLTLVMQGGYWYLADNGTRTMSESAAADAADAAKTATNYITYIDSTNGIKIAESSSSVSLTFMQLTSSFLDFVRGGNVNAQGMG